ncbi:MAG TPA: cell wall hydrolase [Gammaproteobacteria bacterium]
MRELLADWRYRLLFHWYAWEKGNVVFFSLLPLPVVLLGFLVHFAYEDWSRIEAERRRRVDLQCLAENVYYEARGEPVSGQYAVAEVTMNRVRARQFPSTVCDVVHEKRWDPLRKRLVGAFSWTELERLPRPRGPAWDRARAVAEAVYDQKEAPRVEGALYYHAEHIEPSWAKEKRLVAEIGRHRFYR